MPLAAASLHAALADANKARAHLHLAFFGTMKRRGPGDGCGHARGDSCLEPLAGRGAGGALEAAGFAIEIECREPEEGRLLRLALSPGRGDSNA